MPVCFLFGEPSFGGKFVLEYVIWLCFMCLCECVYLCVYVCVMCELDRFCGCVWKLKAM